MTPPALDLSTLDAQTVGRIATRAFGFPYKVERRLSTHKASNVASFIVQRGRERFVLHIGPASAVMDTSPLTYEHLVHQDTRIAAFPDTYGEIAVTLRKKADLVLADLDIDELFNTNDDLNEALKVRWQLLEDVLAGLSELHASNGFADVRPSNIAYNEETGVWEIMDWNWRTAFADLEEELDFVAKDGLVEVSGAEADVYAFGRLAQRVLGAFRWDNRDLPGIPSLRDDEFEWILDYCTAVAPRDRPTVGELSRRLFRSDRTQRRRISNQVSARLDGARAWAVGHVKRRQAIAPKHVEKVLDLATKRIGVLLKRFPETEIALLPEMRAERILMRIALDIYASDFHSGRRIRRHWRRTAPLNEHQPVDQFDTDIDLQWRDRLHRLHFGIPMDLDHENRMSRASHARLDLPGREMYLRHIEGSNHVRANLISKHAFLHTAEVASLMSTLEDPVSISDVTVLRRWGDILAVPDHGRWLYPVFQFEPETGLPSRAIRQVSDRFADPEDKWGELSWWSIPRATLAGLALAECLMQRNGDAAVQRALDSLAS